MVPRTRQDGGVVHVCRQKLAENLVAALCSARDAQCKNAVRLGFVRRLRRLGRLFEQARAAGSRTSGMHA